MARRRYTRLRIIGVLVLLAGLSGAALLYRVETRSAGPSMDELLPGYTDMQRRQMGILFGGTGVVLSEAFDDLKYPGSQAAIIVLASTVFAWGCFYVARGLEENQDDDPDATPSDG